MKFSNFVLGVGLFTPCFVLGKIFVHNDYPDGRIFAPFESCSAGFILGGGGWLMMKVIAALVRDSRMYTHASGCLRSMYVNRPSV